MGDVEIPSWLKGLPLAPEFHPTETEFADPIAYISKIEKEASAFGICKVIPPLPKPSKKYVVSNLNKSLSKCPELLNDTTGNSSSQMGIGDRGNEGEFRAVFTTRQQELGLCPKLLKGPVPIGKLAVQKQVWQSGEVYTLDQFESKSKAFARSQLSGVKEVTPLVVESLFWKAASEKPIYVEYANDVPGSGFGEPEEPLRYFRKRKRRRRFNQKHQEGVGSEKPEVKTTIDQTHNADKSIPCSSALLSDESSRLSRQKSVMNAACSEREGTAGWKISNCPWNLQVIAQSRGSLTRFMLDDIPGVTSPMVYIGMLFSWFAWHVEDHELHSLNFLHMGAPKTWYAIPGDYAFALEEVVRVQGYGEHLDRLGALTLLGEKTTLLSPEVVVSSGIPCCRVVQHPGEFVVTFPRAYHIGFSHGFNCGEAANFATSQWLKVAKEAAVRRAAMNYLPMLSHQQLLYLLTMSFVSRVPRTLLPGVRSSRLRDRIKEEREILVKKAFLDDMVTENQRLVVLLGKSSTSYVVLWDPDLLPSSTNGHQDLLPSPTNCPTFPSASLEPSNSLFGVKSSEFEKDCSDKEIALHDATATLCGRTSIDWQENNHDDKVNSTSPYVEPTDFLYGDYDDLPYGLHVDSGTLACVACGVLGFPFMCIMQPSERASKELFHEEGLGSMKSPELPTPNMDEVVKDFDSDNAKAVTVEFMAQDEQEDDETGNSSPRCGEHAPVPEIPEATRDFKLAKNVSLECTSNMDNTLPEVIADKEPKQTNTLCHSIRDSSSSGLNKSIQCEKSFSPLPGFSEIPVDLPTPSTFDGGNEIYQSSHITDKAKQNDMQIDSLIESEGNTYLNVSGIVPCYKTEGPLREPAQRSGDEVSRKWNTSNVFLRPRIFCLEHGLEIEELLQCQGGANVLIICHSDYPKIKAHAPSIAEEVGVHFNCEDISMDTASQADLDLINISIDDEAEECGEDWSAKLALNLRHYVNVRKLSPSKGVKHALDLGGLFSVQVELNISTLKWQSRKSRSRNNNLHKRKSDDKMVSRSGVNVFTKKQVLGDIYEPCHVAQACRSRGRGRPRKHALRGSSSANETVSNDNNEPENKTSENACGSPPHSNEKVENDSAQVVNSPTIMDPTAKSSEALEVISTTPETDMVGGTYDSISNTIDNPVGKVPENQQRQTLDSAGLVGEGCYPERSKDLPHIAFTEVSSAEETKQAIKVCDSTSSVCLLSIGAPEVENSKMQQEIVVAEGITLEGGICDIASICAVDSFRAQEKTHTTEGNPVVAEFCTSAKLPPLPALEKCATKTPKIQEEIQTIEETAATEISCDSETSVDVATVGISMSKHSDKLSEIRTTEERSSGDNPHDAVKLAGLPTIAASMVESPEMKLDVRTATENCSLMGEVCFSSEPAGPPTILSISVVENSEVQHDAQITDKTRALQEVLSSRCGMEKDNSRPILVYSRVRKNQRKRKVVFDEEMELDAQESCNGFIRSPCEGLRSRTGRKVAGEMDGSRTPEESKPAKKAKMVPGSSGGYRDEKKSKASYRCDLDGCHMRFTTKGELQLHKRNRCTHEGCEKRFSSHKYAMQHERVHNDDRPLKCPWKGCGMSFKWAWARTEHMRLHTGERPYQCKYAGCGLTFMFVSEFSRHRRRTGHFVTDST